MWRIWSRIGCLCQNSILDNWVVSISWSTIPLLYCTVLYCIVLYCTILHYTVQYVVLRIWSRIGCLCQNSILDNSVVSLSWSTIPLLYCTVLYCTVLYCTVQCPPFHYCTVLYCRPRHFSTNVHFDFPSITVLIFQNIFMIFFSSTLKHIPFFRCLFQNTMHAWTCAQKCTKLDISEQGMSRAFQWYPTWLTFVHS